MNIREFIGTDIYDKLPKEKQEELNKWVPRSRFDEVIGQKNELKEQVDTLNKTLKDSNKSLEEMKKSVGDNAELQKQLEEYQAKVSNTQKEFGDTLKAKETEWANKEVNTRKAYAVREKLLTEHADAKYMDMLMGQVDLSKITESDGKFIGVDDIVGGIKTNYEKLFGKVQTVGTPPGTGTHHGMTENLEKLAEKARGGRPEDRLAYMNAKRDAETEQE